MLDTNNLAQLKQLKKQLIDQKEYATGVVKGTQRRFGFVVTNDSREIFLPPEEMQKVFPADTVKILLKTDDKGKVSGIVEKVKASTLCEFTGHYIVKGQGHFVQPDLPRFNRWIFIPSSARKGAKPGDYIRCKISRHAYPHAKPQASIINIIGPTDQPGIEADYIVNKFQLQRPWPKNWQESIINVDTSQRQDLTNIPFVTIDAVGTTDLDDAVYATETTNGWQLYVAIADPSAHIAPNSELETAIAQRGTSIYFPERNIPMLPAELANIQCSLTCSDEKPALVCTIDIHSDGTLANYTIAEAIVRSRSQLSFDEVAEHIDSNITNDNCATHIETLCALKHLSQALREQRKKSNLVIEGRPDYKLVLDEKKKLSHIEIKPKSSAHILIEECMVAANRCAADILGEHGVFISHSGFRKERLPDACKLAQEQLSLTGLDVTTVEGYKQLMDAIDDDVLAFPLRSVLSRLLERSQISNQPLPHYGMALNVYTTFTSPIRKYNDFLVHKLIKSKITNNKIQMLDQGVLDTLQQTLANARQAQYQVEQWLKCQFTQALIGKQFDGHVCQINSSGFTVRLDNYLIEGFVETKPLKEKYSFDPMRLRLSSKNLIIELDQAISVVVKSVDCNERTIFFTLPDQAALSDNGNQSTTKNLHSKKPAKRE